MGLTGHIPLSNNTSHHKIWDIIKKRYNSRRQAFPVCLPYEQADVVRYSAGRAYEDYGNSTLGRMFTRSGSQKVISRVKTTAQPIFFLQDQQRQSAAHQDFSGNGNSYDVFPQCFLSTIPGRSHHPGVPFPTLGSSDVYFRKEVLSVRCILESSDRCPNIRTVAPPNNLVLRVPCRPPIITVCGRTYHTV